MTALLTETKKDALPTEWVSYVPLERDARANALINLSFWEQVERITAPAPRDHAIRWQIPMIRDLYGEALEAREERARESRLSGLRQHGCKDNRGTVGTVFPINRFHHSRIVAAYAMVFALCAQRQPKEAVEACEGGWRHDDRHPAYCHTAEHLITRSPYFVDTHEERSLSAMLNDRALLTFALDRNLSLGNMMEAMRERGRFPTQSPADTTGYTEHDDLFIGFDVPGDYGWRIASSILGAEGGRLVVDDPEPLQGVLDRRNRAHQEFYSSHMGRVSDSAMELLLHFMFGRKIIGTKDVVEGVDANVDVHLLAMLRGELDVPDWAMSLLEVARGDMNELRTSWHEHALLDKDEYERTRDRLLAQRHDVIAAPARAFWSKKIRIVSTSGIESVLQAVPSLTTTDRTWYLYTYER